MCDHTGTTVKLNKQRTWEWCSHCGAIRNANPEWGYLIDPNRDWILPKLQNENQALPLPLFVDRDPDSVGV